MVRVIIVAAERKAQVARVAAVIAIRIFVAEPTERGGSID